MKTLSPLERLIYKLCLSIHWPEHAEHYIDTLTQKKQNEQ